MAWTSTTFLERFPEFSNLDAPVVTATIQEAERQNNADIWGDQYDDAVLYLTGHLLASRTQAIGQQVGVTGSARVSKYVGAAGYTLADTTYGAAYLFLREGVVEMTGFCF
jgi:hypothetical protein|tara:strand:+ start:585 stop:914 length:330 start_codon:yes stop_codon:yes gene_type:complete